MLSFSSPLSNIHYLGGQDAGVVLLTSSRRLDESPALFVDRGWGELESGAQGKLGAVVGWHFTAGVGSHIKRKGVLVALHACKMEQACHQDQPRVRSPEGHNFWGELSLSRENFNKIWTGFPIFWFLVVLAFPPTSTRWFDQHFQAFPLSKKWCRLILAASRMNNSSEIIRQK